MADYTLEARVTADTSDFNAGMSDAADALGDLGSQAGRAGASAGKAGGGLSGFSAKCSALTGAVMGAAASITSNLVGGFGDLVSSAAAAADSTQKFKSTLDFAGLGADEIESLSKSTRAYADQTVYSLSDIQNTTAQLAANGVKDYDRLAEAAGNLNAVAGGNADTFKSVGMVLTQTAGQGKLTTENFNQLADAIPGASGKIQQALADMGAYTGNFRDAMEEGQISAQEFNDAIMSLGFEDAAVKAATSTSTIEGAMGNLQATLEGGLADSITILTPAITNLANSINENLGPAFETFNGFLQTFIDGLDAGKDPIQAFADAFVTLPEPVQQVATAIVALGAAFAAYKIASTFLGIAQSVRGLVSGFTGLGSSIGPAASSLGGLGSGLGGVSSSASSAALQISAVGVAALGIGAGIGAAAAGMSMLVQAAIQLGSAGPAAQIAMVGLVAGIAALAAGAVAAGPALTAAAVGVGVFGAAVLGIGAGIGIASAGLALLATQLPTIASSGGDAGTAMIQIAAGAAAMSAGIAACGVALAATAAAMVAATASFGAFSLAVGAAALAASASNGQFRGLYDSIEGIPAKVEDASDAFHGLGPSAEDAGREAAKAIADACDDMRREVSNLKLRLPRIEVGPLPHFSLRGSFNPQTGAVPSVSVSWYAKGGIFDGASVIGVGERGPEAVVPLTGRRMAPFAQAIADAMGGSGTTNVYYIGDTQVTTMDDRSFAESFIRLMTDSGRLART